MVHANRCTIHVWTTLRTMRNPLILKDGPASPGDYQEVITIKHRDTMLTNLDRVTHLARTMVAVVVGATLLTPSDVLAKGLINGADLSFPWFVFAYVGSLLGVVVVLYVIALIEETWFPKNWGDDDDEPWIAPPEVYRSHASFMHTPPPHALTSQRYTLTVQYGAPEAGGEISETRT